VTQSGHYLLGKQNLSGVPTCRGLHAAVRSVALLILPPQNRQTLATPHGHSQCDVGQGGGMADLWQFIDEIDADKQAILVKRLEDRAQMPKFAAIRENYFDKIGVPITGRILELGCGTGAVCRAIASRPGFVGTVVGSDLSATLIDTAKDITAKCGLKNIEYYQADGQGSDAHDGQYDLVLAHTVISHVADPAAFLREAIRLARPAGQLVLHGCGHGHGSILPWLNTCS